MRTFRLEKLVRDGIVAGHEQEGGSCVHRTVDGDELAAASEAKVQEEVSELINTEERTAAEYADVMEALFLDAEVAGFTRDDIIRAMLEKAKRIGTFSTHTFVETARVPESSWLAEYYSSNPERYPEV
jgi:predicted house-cleaning noncanonical NTP pyrophosphatase (MazG superfamily)